MARKGTFDPQLEPLAWFDTNAIAEGWFADDLIPAPSSSYTLIADGGVYTYSGDNASLLYSGTPIIVDFDTHDGDKHRKRIRKVRDERELRREQVITAYKTLLEARPQEAAEIVAEYATPATTLRAPSVDFDALLADLDAAERLYQAYIDLDDEEWLLLI